ncbi:MAG TPA: DUF120 domain-containing protein [Hadesarchaea archaeon]|nr:DUF120 domain-containing protein [Hadesarchaea archaeon]
MGKTIPLEMLTKLSKEGAHRRRIKISLNWLAKRLKTSRQTAARRLAELENKGLIERKTGPRGQLIRVTPAGLATIRKFHQELGSILKPVPHAIKISGRVVTGIGEGRYYMSQTHYIKQFEKEAGFTPYPGTLDIKLDKGSLESKEMLLQLPSKEIQGFETKERAFGQVKFFQAKLKNSKVVVVLPVRSHHTEILEIIAPHNLRNVLKLRDGDPVHMEVMI